MGFWVLPSIYIEIFTSAINFMDSNKTSALAGLKNVDDIAPIPSAPFSSACIANSLASHKDWLYFQKMFYSNMYDYR